MVAEDGPDSLGRTTFRRPARSASGTELRRVDRPVHHGVSEREVDRVVLAFDEASAEWDDEALVEHEGEGAHRGRLRILRRACDRHVGVSARPLEHVALAKGAEIATE